MSAVQAARRALERAQRAFENAEQRAADEYAARTARNDLRRDEFWADAGERCQVALRAARDAREAVVSLVGKGDVSGALDAHGEYVRRVTEAKVVVELAKDATATYAYDTDDGVQRITVRAWKRSDPLMPPRGSYRIEYPSGVPDGTAPDADAFLALLTEGLGRLEAEHRSEHATALLEPLRAQLEPED